MSEEKEKEEKVPKLPFTYQLKFPLEFGGTLRDSVTFTRFPRAILDLPVSYANITHGDYVPALASMTGEPEKFFSLVCHQDFKNMLDFAINFF